MEGQPSRATPYLIRSLNIFHQLDKVSDREQARCLAAVSAGQEMMPNYIALILKCGKTGKVGEDHTFKLAQWKDTRELFWSDESCTSLPRTSKVFEIVAKIKTDIPRKFSVSGFEEMMESEIYEETYVLMIKTFARKVYTLFSLQGSDEENQ